MSQHRILSSVYDDVTPGVLVVSETPSEVADIISEGRLTNTPLIELTLANENSAWNGRKVYLDPFSVKAIAPPSHNSPD